MVELIDTINSSYFIYLGAYLIIGGFPLRKMSTKLLNHDISTVLLISFSNHLNFNSHANFVGRFQENNISMPPQLSKFEARATLNKDKNAHPVFFLFLLSNISTYRGLAALYVQPL